MRRSTVGGVLAVGAGAVLLAAGGLWGLWGDAGVPAVAAGLGRGGPGPVVVTLLAGFLALLGGSLVLADARLGLEFDRRQRGLFVVGALAPVVGVGGSLAAGVDVAGSFAAAGLLVQSAGVVLGVGRLVGRARRVSHERDTGRDVEER